MCKIKFISDIVGSNPITGPSSRKDAENASDRLAQEAAAERNAQMERENNIRAAMGDIDTAFGQFGDDFYKGRADAVTKALMPDFEEQERDARRALTLDLSSKGQSQSSVAAKAFRKLAQQAAAGRTKIDQNANAAVNALKSDVLNQRNTLYDQVRGVPDPRATAASLSADAAKRFSDPSAFTYDALGPVFSNLTAGISAVDAANQSAQRRSLANAYARSAGVPGSGEKVIT